MPCAIFRESFFGDLVAAAAIIGTRAVLLIGLEMLFHLTIGIPIGDENRGASSGDGSAPEEIGALFPGSPTRRMTT
jgi:hypothetical protein